MLAIELSKKEQLDERVLLIDLARGDYKAFNTLYAAHVKQLTNYAAKFTNDIQVIEDSIHDIFVWLWHNRASLEITHTLKAYLFNCVRRSVLRKIQKHKKIVLLENAEEDNTFTFFISSEEKYIDTESTSLLKEKMATWLDLLTSKQKEVIYLRFYQDLSFDEIATNMNLTAKACYKLMGRAMSELRKNRLHSLQAYFLIFLSFTSFC
jgi:RNA polymerase sigma factor (sigma-70 family)